MRVVADSHAIFWYVTDNPLLSDAAGQTLDEAFESEGIGVAAVSLLDLWYSTHKNGPTRIEPRHYDRVKSVIEDDEWNVVVLPFTHESATQAESIPRAELPDPFDRMIVAAALEYDVPIVSADKRIAELGVVPVIW